MDAPVVIGYLAPQKVITVFRRITPESLWIAHLGNCLCHCFGNYGGDGSCDITDAEPYYLLVGIEGREFSDPRTDLGKQISLLDIAEVVI